jgi:preprotein translocase subunit SecY
VKITQKLITIIFKRLLLTIGIVLFIRIGTFFPVPGINPMDLAFYLQSHSGTRNLISTFSGNDTFVIGLFTLNIFPYINATIVTQFLVGFLPQLSKLQKEGDLESRRSINRLTRFITLVWALIQSTALSFYLKQILLNWSYGLAFEIILWLTTGAMIVLWLSEFITDYGLGNGSSILIYTNIISNLPNFSKKIILENSENLPFISKIEIISLIFASLYGIVFLQEGIRNIPLISAKQLNQRSLQNSMTDNNYLPLRFNQAGVMPIILTTALLVIPNYISQFGLFANLNFLFNFKAFGFVYWISYFGLILFFSSYYSTLVLNPKGLVLKQHFT